MRWKSSLIVENNSMETVMFVDAFNLRLSAWFGTPAAETIPAAPRRDQPVTAELADLPLRPAVDAEIPLALPDICLLSCAPSRPAAGRTPRIPAPLPVGRPTRWSPSSHHPSRTATP